MCVPDDTKTATTTKNTNKNIKQQQQPQTANTTTTATTPRMKSNNTKSRRELRFLYSLESFDSWGYEGLAVVDDDDDDKTNGGTTNKKKRQSQQQQQQQQQQLPPTFGSCVLTGTVVVSVFFIVEHTLRYILSRQYCQDYHPLLQIENNRNILARHIGVDAFSCFVCAILGLSSIHVCIDVFKQTFQRSTSSTSSSRQDYSHKKNDDDSTNNGNSNQVPSSSSSSSLSSTATTLLHADDHCERLFTYNPHAFRIALFFLCYQFKNTYDTVVWNDGPEFIFHHIFSIFTAYGALYPGCGHMYTIFFFGISEISTAILCLLANFDDVHGVIGLGEAFPMAKIALGGLFVVGFITCRVVLWPIFSYYFGRDVLLALKSSPNDPRVQLRRHWMKFFLISLTGISCLQIAWLGQIFILGKQELTKAGLL